MHQEIECVFHLTYFHLSGWFLTIKNAAYYSTGSRSRHHQFREISAKAGLTGEFTDDWLDWFIGFFEGDGYIMVSGRRCFFVMTQKEEAVVRMIHNTFGFGRLVYDSKVNAWRWIVDATQGAVLLASLFNGNLHVPHIITQLSKAIKAINDSVTNPKSRHFNFVPAMELISTPAVVSLTNAWLSGFTDAEGCFNIDSNKQR